MATRSDTVLAVAVGAVVAAAAVAGVLAGAREAAHYDPATPAGVVQSYLRAVADRDTAAAVALLAQNTGCTETDLAGSWWSDDFRADLADQDEGPDIASVQVTITTATGDPFDTGWSDEQTFGLRREDGVWRITGAPWPMMFCDSKDGS